ncbi:MAG: hypothetical protein KKF24_13950, partial [Gammaproteobacteria bacterium]|nr:hypothetical protein [Gammaproteobacteria bacterium]
QRVGNPAETHVSWASATSYRVYPPLTDTLSTENTQHLVLANSGKPHYLVCQLQPNPIYRVSAKPK